MAITLITGSQLRKVSFPVSSLVQNWREPRNWKAEHVHQGSKPGLHLECQQVAPVRLSYQSIKLDT